MTLQEVKDQIAKEYKYESWESLRHCNSMNYGQWETFSDRAAELYAKEIADKAWEAGVKHGFDPERHYSTAEAKAECFKELFPETKPVHSEDIKDTSTRLG